MAAHHLPGSSASQTGFHSLMRSGQRPLFGKTSFWVGQEQGGPPAPPFPRASAAAAFWNGFQDPLFSLTFPKAPQEARQLLIPNAGSRGRDRAGALLTGSQRERPFRPEKHVLFFPKEVGPGKANLGTLTHPRCTLGCLSHLSRQYNNEGELGNFRRGN